MVSSTPRPHFTPGKDTVPILQEAGWTPGPVWTGGKSRPHRDSIPDRPARSQSLYRLSYRAQNCSNKAANVRVERKKFICAGEEATVIFLSWSSNYLYTEKFNAKEGRIF